MYEAQFPTENAHVLVPPNTTYRVKNVKSILSMKRLIAGHGRAMQGNEISVPSSVINFISQRQLLR